MNFIKNLADCREKRHRPVVGRILRASPVLKIGTTTASFQAVGKVAVFRERLNQYYIEFDKNGAHTHRKRLLIIRSEVDWKAL